MFPRETVQGINILRLSSQSAFDCLFLNNGAGFCKLVTFVPNKTLSFVNREDLKGIAGWSISLLDLEYFRFSWLLWSGAWRGDLQGGFTPSPCPVGAVPRCFYIPRLGGHCARQVLLLHVSSPCSNCLRAPTWQLQPTCVLDECLLLAIVSCGSLPASFGALVPDWCIRDRCGIDCFPNDYG